ncbi:MAG TPA: YXWGXW repeat-containing protein [Steroidobacteraceae bacterium]
MTAVSIARGIAVSLTAATLSACVVAPAQYPPPPPPQTYSPPQSYAPPQTYAPPAYAPADNGDYESDYSMSAQEAPPPMPVYEQPPIPAEGYIWTPGYWNYTGGDYFWVPGTWVQPPRVGVLWTPGFWALAAGVYIFHAGYWGPHVGFYGGINYGCGYTGEGYAGGRWQGSEFHYNQTVNNINTTIVHNTYNETVVNNITVNNVSYAGAPGTRTQPNAQELQAAREPHVSATPQQRQHINAARANPALFAGANHGVPPIAASSRPGVFTESQVTRPRQGIANPGQPNGGTFGARGLAAPGTMQRPEPPPVQSEPNRGEMPQYQNRPEPAAQPQQAAPQPQYRPESQPQPQPQPQYKPAPQQQQYKPAPQQQSKPAAKPPAKPAPKKNKDEKERPRQEGEGNH